MLAVGLVMVLQMGAVAEAAVQAQVDRNPVMLNESFRLTFELDDKPSAEPDLSVLERDFEILGRSQRSNISFVNGDLQRSTTFILNLMPRRTGELVIAPVDFGVARSEPITVRVVDAAPADADAGQDLFLEVTVDERRPRVQQQVLLTIRLLRTVEINNATLSEPSLSAGAVVQELGKDRNYHDTRDGRRYAVIERQFAVFPQASGELVINPFRFDGQVIKGGRSFFDPFGQSISTRRLTSQPITLEVLPAADGFTGNTWLPAESLALNEVWSDDGTGQWTVGTPVTRTVAIIARGLTAGQLPEIDQQLPDGLKVYPEQPALNDQASADGVTGVRQEKVALIPTRPGQLALPPVRLRWWNTETGEQAIAELPARSVQVLPAAGAAPPPSTPAADEGAAPAAPAPQPDAEPASPRAPAGPWIWVAAALCIAWLGTLAAWFVTSRRAGVRNTPTGGADSETKMKIRELRHLIANADPDEIKAGFLQWASGEWPDQPPNSLSELGGRVDARLATELDRLSACLYGQAPGGLDRTALRGALDGWNGRPGTPGDGRLEPQHLEPLFRHGTEGPQGTNGHAAGD